VWKKDKMGGKNNQSETLLIMRRIKGGVLHKNVVMLKEESGLREGKFPVLMAGCFLRGVCV